MTKYLSGLLFAAMFALSPAYAENWTLDAEKSKIDFVGKKPDGAHKGGFKGFKSEVKADLENPQNGSMKLEIEAESLWSDDPKLTEHLKNPDFFDVKKYPTIKFESTKIDMQGEEGTITGKLTLLDKTIEVKVPVKAEVSDSSVKVIADFKIDRTKWGMNYGKGKIDDEVSLKAELVFAR